MVDKKGEEGVEGARMVVNGKNGALLRNRWIHQQSPYTLIKKLV